MSKALDLEPGLARDPGDPGSDRPRVSSQVRVLGPKLLLVMGCVKLGEKNCVRLPSVGEQTATQFHATHGK